MIKRLIKYLLLFALFIGVLMLLLFTYIWQTNSGSRWLVNQAIMTSGQDITYAQISGTLSKGLVINNFRYNSEIIEIKATLIDYQSAVNWLDKRLEIDDMSIKQLEITPKAVVAADNESNGLKPFQGVELPLIIDVKQLSVDELTIQNPASSYLIDRVKFSALFDREAAQIHQLVVNSEPLNFSGDGQVKYSSGFNYALNTQWQLLPNEPRIAGMGQVNGGLDQVALQQNINIDSNGIETEVELTGTVIGLTSEAVVNLNLRTPQISIQQASERIKLQHFSTQLKGALNDYQVELSTAITSAQLPTTQVMLSATGDLYGLETKDMKFTTPEGQIDLNANASWKNDIQLHSQVNINNFNPQQILTAWPGIINGVLEIDVLMNQSGPVIEVVNSQLNGKLKAQAFKLNGKLRYQSKQISADDFTLILGDNEVLLNGRLDSENADLTASVSFPDLTVLHDQLGGLLRGELLITGDPLKPQIRANINAENIDFQDNQIAAFNMVSDGQWGATLNTELKAFDITVAAQKIHTLTLSQTGWLDSHQVTMALSQDDLSTSFAVTGGLSQDTQQAWQWHGELTEHVLNMGADHQLKLKQAVAIEVNDSITIDEACWQSQSDGSLCLLVALQRAQTTASFTHISSQLLVEQLDIQPLDLLLPEQLKLSGLLEGHVNAEISADEIAISSALALKGGEVALQNDAEIIYQTNISELSITTATDNNTTQFSLKSSLADESHFNVQAQLAPTAQETWQIDADISALIKATQIIQELTPEITEINGQLYLSGQIKGPIQKPLIELNVTQPQGYIIVSRSGTVIEQLALNIKTQGNKEPIYHISMTANNLTELNQGQFKTEGEFSFSDNNWQYQGQITGDNFMVLNLPEMKFNLTPDLNIKADSKQLSISGQVDVEYGHVMVEQLPASTVSNSPDLVIITPAETTESAYPISIDIQATINNPIALDVIGLKAGLNGSIKLKQTATQPLQGNGVLKLIDGNYEIYGQKLDIKQGELTFTGPLDNPRLNIKASRLSVDEAVTVGVELGGTVNNLQSTLFSEPNLSDIEKLAYIMTGRGLEGSGNLDGEELKEAAIVMGLNQSSPLFNQIQTQFGIDVLTIRESSLVDDTVVEAGKKLNDRLYISYNQGLFSRVGFWVLKYKINEYLNLQSTQGDDQAIGLVYTRKAEIPEK